MQAVMVWTKLRALAALIGCRVDELLGMSAAEVQRRKAAKLGIS